MDKKVDKATEENMENGMTEEEAKEAAQATPESELPALSEEEENALISENVPGLTNDLVQKNAAAGAGGKGGKGGSGGPGGNGGPGGSGGDGSGEMELGRMEVGQMELMV